MERTLAQKMELTMQLVVERLACRRAERLLFADLSFRLPAGAAAWISGPNGAGKTSLLRILAGLLAPAAGRCAWSPDSATPAPERELVPLSERSTFVGVAGGV